MSPVLLLGIVLCVSPSFAQNYDQIWQDMLMGGSAPLNPTQIGLYFRAMMRPPPDPEDPTATTRADFKFFWRDAYHDTERIADGLFSFFDGHKDEIIDGHDLLPLMNIADTNVVGDGVLNRAEFNSYMDLAYDYAGNQRLLPSNTHHAPGQAHQHGNNHHLHHQGKPFFG